MNESSFLCDVSESSVAIVLVQVVCGFFPRRKPFEARTIQYEDIEPPVIVVIVERDPASVGFHDILYSFNTTVIDRIDQACLLRNINELYTVRLARLRGWYCCRQDW